MFLPLGGFEGAVEDVGAAGDQEQSGFEQDEHLGFGNPVQGAEFHMAFPCLENDFDAPAQAVDGQQLCEVGALCWNGGDENGPAQEFEKGLGGVAAMGLVACLHAAEVGDFLTDGRADEAHGCVRGVVEQDGEVEMAVFSEQGEEVDGFFGLGVEIEGCGFVAVNAVGSGIEVALDFIEDEVTAVAQDEVVGLELQIGCGGEVVSGIGVDGKVDEAAGEEVVDGLDAGVADFGAGVGDAGKLFEEMGGEFDDGAVLDENAFVAGEAGEIVCVLEKLAMGLEEFFGDEIFENGADENGEGWIHALVDGLARGAVARVLGFNIGGEVVVTRRTFEAFDAKGGQEVADIDLARRAIVEVGGSSHLEKVILVEGNACDGDEWGCGVLGAELDVGWVHCLTIV